MAMLGAELPAYNLATLNAPQVVMIAYPLSKVHWEVAAQAIGQSNVAGILGRQQETQTPMPGSSHAGNKQASHRSEMLS